MNEIIWNILHDGSIQKIGGEIPGNIILEVKIEYLSQMFSKSFKSITVKLDGCSLFEYYKDYKPPPFSDFEEKTKVKPWITSGEIKNEGLIIFCNDGFFRTEYQKSQIFLEDQTPISEQQLEEKSKIYWDNFGK